MSLKCTDKDRFMKGEKFVAIISRCDISLQPDRRVKNRKRTVYKRWLLLAELLQ